MDEIAIERIELHPADQSQALLAIALPGEFHRVGTVEPSSTLTQQRRYAEDTNLSHGATVAYRIDNAILADHTLYSSGAYETFRPGGKRVVLTGAYDEFPEAQLCTYPSSSIYFGNWLREALTSELLAKQRGLPPLSFKKAPWLHEPGYRKMLGLQGMQISFARVGRLWVIDDRGLNAGWVKRFRELRTRVRTTVKPRGPTHVFLARGRRGTSRELLNARAISDLLVARGFVVIEPELLSPQEIVDALGSARIVITVAGSAINHAHYSVPEGSGILVIEPPDRFNAMHRVLTSFTAIRFGYVVGDPAVGGFSLQPDRLLKTLDYLETSLP